MTGEEISAIVKDRIDKVLEEANKEFLGWEITASNDCCYDEFIVFAEERPRLIEDFTKEELLNMIKKALLDVDRITQSYDSIRRKLHNFEYSMQNAEKLEEITFDIALVAARNYVHNISVCFKDLTCSLMKYDKNWLDDIQSIDVSSVDPTSFFRVKKVEDILGPNVQDVQ
jgi:hypothetical protein